jgi:protein involved in polysaccharide export with SLBB domain
MNKKLVLYFILILNILVFPSFTYANDNINTPIKSENNSADFTAKDTKQSDYVLGPEDEISVYVWRNKELSFENIIIRPNGYISLPILGNVNVCGLTCRQLEERLVSSLLPYIKSPRVSVNMNKKRFFRIYIVGQVKKPGVYDIRRAQTTVSEALALSEGVTERAALQRCLIQRKGQTISVNLEEYLKAGNTKNDATLEEGDVLVIPETNQRVAVMGEVQKPGVYDLKEGENLFQALTTAGWFNNKARVSQIAVFRANAQGKVEKNIINLRDLNKNSKEGDEIFKKIALQNGDIIYVPEIKGPSMDNIYRFVTSIYSLRVFFPNF